ncbi:MAG: hypothetical protein AABY22_14170 [Nanoarchaeota archaeon]
MMFLNEKIFSPKLTGWSFSAFPIRCESYNLVHQFFLLKNKLLLTSCYTNGEYYLNQDKFFKEIS